ncbi:hypothetical protein [Solibacillus sp. CAU 1738]|uniref:hypothetical protein n=1 Tax=Solibacillus sp. CAU 1738 TaxID=3140363 RepID=UPI0032615017
MKKDKFNSLMNKVVKIDRGGPESNVGMLLAAEDDYITMLTEKDGVVYYQAKHIKSITNDSKGGMKFNIEVPTDFTFHQGETFKCVLENLRYHWISVNRGGPEKLEGVLDEVTDDYLIIILNEEIIYVAMYHIKSISYGLKVEKKEENEKEERKASTE